MTELQGFEKLRIAANSAAISFKPFSEAMQTLLKKIGGLIRAEYERAGKPYGDSDEDMWRWFDDVSSEIKANRRRRQ